MKISKSVKIIIVTAILVFAGLRAYNYYLTTEIERIQAEIDALTTEVVVECGFEAGVALVTVRVPTKILDAMDAWEVDEFKAMVCDESREAINEAMGNE